MQICFFHNLLRIHQIYVRISRHLTMTSENEHGYNLKNVEQMNSLLLNVELIGLVTAFPLS